MARPVLGFSGKNFAPLPANVQPDETIELKNGETLTTTSGTAEHRYSTTDDDD